MLKKHRLSDNNQIMSESLNHFLANFKVKITYLRVSYPSPLQQWSRAKFSALPKGKTKGQSFSEILGSSGFLGRSGKTLVQSRQVSVQSGEPTELLNGKHKE